MNHLLYITLKKSKLNKLIYQACKYWCHKRISIGTESVNQAETLLQSIQADPKNSCICKNQLVEQPQYDLQIIVPAYNVEKYIKECLYSILTQKTSFRYLVKIIDDASTDGTPQILEHYQNVSQIQIVHQQNKGFSGARNTGLEKIEARYVMFLDSDDKLAPGAIQSLMEIAQKTGADIVEGSSSKFGGLYVYKKFCHVEAAKANADCLFGFAWGKVYKATLFRNVHFPDGYWFEDTLCAFILHPLAKHVSTTVHQVYAYRTNFNGISRNFRGKSKVLDSFYISRQLLKDRKDLNETFDESLANKVARQFLLNANRIASLGRDDVDRALFVLQSDLFRHYFSESEARSSLALTLWQRDYGAFTLQRKWL